MKLHLLSDLHLDHDKKLDEAFLKNLKEQPDIDVLVLCGDNFSIHRKKRTEDLFKRLLDCYREILFVPGNHEMWRATPAEVHETLFYIEESSCGRVHSFITPSHCYAGRNHDQHRFFGGTLWYPQPKPNQIPMFRDHEEVRTPWAWFYDQYNHFDTKIQKLGSLKDTIVISHHLPTPAAVADKFKHNPNNHFFMADMDHIIYDQEPKLWLFGHTHTRMDFVVHNTRLVCNPRGYPWEYKAGDAYEPLLIEV